ncbi:MAG: hypothetical protein IPH08_04580 [Rhodocyclaceae bacterium]|nr:hypothetical protein [Rhodocyclaceae bacterium]
MTTEIEFHTVEIDENDRATLVELQFNEDSIAEARRRSAPETHPDFDGTHCVRCDVAIPKARLHLGKVRCVDCQTVLERTSRLYR